MISPVVLSTFSITPRPGFHLAATLAEGWEPACPAFAGFAAGSFFTGLSEFMGLSEKCVVRFFKGSDGRVMSGVLPAVVDCVAALVAGDFKGLSSNLLVVV